MLRQSSIIRGLPPFCHIILSITSVPQFPEFCNPRADNQIPWFSKNTVWRILYFWLIPSFLGESFNWDFGKTKKFCNPSQSHGRAAPSQNEQAGFERETMPFISIIHLQYWIIRKALQFSLQNGADWDTTYYCTLATNLNGPIHPISIGILHTYSQVRESMICRKNNSSSSAVIVHLQYSVHEKKKICHGERIVVPQFLLLLCHEFSWQWLIWM